MKNINEEATFEETKAMKRKCYIDPLTIIKVVVAIVTMIVVIVVFSKVTNLYEMAIQQSKISAGISSGTIINKEIVKTGGGLFTNSQTAYRITINGTYTDSNGQEYEGETYFDVPIEVYREYEIGDTFDEKNL